MLMDMYHVFRNVDSARRYTLTGATYSRGPLRVARSTIPGDAKALKSGTGSCIGTTLFHYGSYQVSI